jgi:hypothetical protein
MLLKQKKRSIFCSIRVALALLSSVSFGLPALAESAQSDKLPAGAVKELAGDKQAAPIKETLSASHDGSGAKVSNSRAGDREAPAAETPSQASTAATAVTTGAGTATTPETKPVEKAAGNTTTAPVLAKPGQELSIGTDTEDLQPTDDVSLARKQVQAYPDSPEASFILAVALTRTSHVEEALQEVRRAKKLAESKGGPEYFDKMIATYEGMLKNFPKENRVRYGLAWAYYMKAYLLAQKSQKIQKWNAAQAALKAQGQGAAGNGTAGNPVTAAQIPAAPKKKEIWDLAAQAAAGTASGDASAKPHIEGALEKADPTLRPQIKKYYEAALTKLDELLAQKPDDLWAKVYRAFLRTEYTGNLDEGMATWRACRDQYPNNPAPYFFLGEGYLKQGNLKECFNNVSKAIALRSLGN